MQILCVAVNYWSDDYTCQFASSLWRARGSDEVQLSVVDNTERDDASELSAEVEGVYPDAHVLKPEGNLGYLGAVRWALAERLKDGEPPDWLMICNVDLEVTGDDFFGGLQGLGGRDSAIVGPAIVSSGGVDSNPQYVVRPSASKMRRIAKAFARKWSADLYALASVVGRPFRARPTYETPCRVYSVHGSCFLLSRAYFEAGGDLEYPCFLFGEEIYLAEAARRLGLGVVYQPSMRVTHRGHVGTGLFRRGQLAEWQAQSAAFAAREYFTP